MIKNYNRISAVSYARKWALKRNPLYYNFDDVMLGGDCTNFVSQCLYAGGGVMNFTKTFGWYYRGLNDRSPAWTGVEQLHKFLVNNKGMGPFAVEKPLYEAELGDIIQLSFDGVKYSHSLLISQIDDYSPNGIKICCHTYDSLDKPLSEYFYAEMRLLHIQGVRIN